MYVHRNDPDWEPDPYPSPWTSPGPLGPSTIETSRDKKALSVTHDLTDSELRRFINFDVYYDPMPMLGFIPQWVLLVVIFGSLGVGLGFMSIKTPSLRIILGGLIFPLLFLVIFHMVTATMRRQARGLGLCRGRTVTISPRGLFVQIPGARGTMIGIGAGMHSWSEIRKISASKDDLTFWMRPTPPGDWEGRVRVNVPLRVFASAAEAAMFTDAARRWHAIATGADAQWWDEGNP